MTSEKKVSLRYLVLLALAVLFCFLTMDYIDITITGRYGFTFWDSLFDGKLLSFYENALASGVAPEGAVYDMGMYIVFGLWVLPVWIIGKIAAINTMSVLCLMWYKLLVILFVGLSSYELFRLAKKLTGFEMDAVSTVFLYVTSVMVFFPTIVVAQYDIIAVYFVLFGTNSFLEKKEKLFILGFSFAMMIKPFPVFAYVLLLLIAQKNIWKIIVRLIAGAAPFLICKLLYATTEGFINSAGAFNDKSMDALFGAVISTNNGGTSLFFLGLILLYGAAYFWSGSEKIKDKNYLVLFLMTVLWADFVTFVTTAPYWIIYLEPFLLVTALCGKEINSKLILEQLVNIFILISMIFKFPWVYGGDTTYSYLVMKGLTKGFLENSHGITVAGALRKLSIEKYVPVIDACFLGCLLLLLIYGLKELFGTNKSEEKNVLNIWHFRVRMAVIYGWILISLAALYLSIRIRG